MGADDQLAKRFGKDFAEGTVLFREGDEGREMFVIRSGQVAISKRVRDVEKQLSTLGPGEFFGEMSLLTKKPRSATAVLLTDAKMLVIDPKTFEAMLRGNAEIAVRMIKMLADRLDQADLQICKSGCCADPGSRVVHYLMHAAESRGQKTGPGALVPLQIADLPAILGIGPEQLKEALQKLTRAGVATFQVDLGADGRPRQTQGIPGRARAEGGQRTNGSLALSAIDLKILAYYGRPAAQSTPDHQLPARRLAGRRPRRHAVPDPHGSTRSSRSITSCSRTRTSITSRTCR